VRNVKELFLEVFKRLLAERRGDVLAWNPEVCSTEAKHPQYALVAPGLFANMAVFPQYRLWDIQNALDEFDMADDLLIKFASDEADEEVIEGFAEPGNEEESVPVGWGAAPGSTLGAQRRILPLKSSVARGWLGLVPDQGEIVFNLGPDQRTTILDRVDLIGFGREDDEVVGDDSACRVLPPQRIWEPQSPLLADSAPDCPLIPDTREDGVIYAEWIFVSPITQKPETPGPSPSGPDELHLRLRRRISSSSALFKSIRKLVNVAVR
jgi:hypothetical protein